MNQPTPMPNRKMWAVIISAFVVGVAQSLVYTYLPGADLTQSWPHLDIIVQSLVMIGAGYMVPEKSAI